jgi:DNA-binding transcriptional LysR family regulator
VNLYGPDGFPETDVDYDHGEPHAHPLAQIKASKLVDCQGADFVMYTRKMAPGLHDLIMDISHKNGLTPHVVQEASEMCTLISLITTGLGIAVAPRRLLCIS